MFTQNEIKEILNQGENASVEFSTNRQATQPELMRLFQSAGMFHYDRVGVLNTSERDINMNLVDEYFRK